LALSLTDKDVKVAGVFCVDRNPAHQLAVGGKLLVVEMLLQIAHATHSLTHSPESDIENALMAEAISRLFDTRNPIDFCTIYV